MKTYAFLLLGLVGMFLAACPHPSPPTQPSPSPKPSPVINDTISTCPATTQATPADVCDGWFTQDGHACVLCHNGSGCMKKDIEVYCASGPCAQDPACHFVAGR